MKKIVTILFVLSISVLAVEAKDNNPDWAKFYRYAAANDTLKTSGVRPKAVIMGDSITDNWLKFDRPFFSENNIAGRGVSGQVTSQMLVRFRDDVLALRPKYLVILAGTNDIAMNNGPITLEHILGNIASMCELAKLHKIKVVLCSVLPASAYRWRPGITPAEDIKALNAMIESYAVEHGLKYVDFWSLLANENGGLDPDKAKDGVHPNLDTYRLMESLLLKALK